MNLKVLDNDTEVNDLDLNNIHNIFTNLDIYIHKIFLGFDSKQVNALEGF